MEGKDKLIGVVREEVTKLFQQVLDYTSVAVSDQNIYKALRGKVLRVGNDCIRNIISDLKYYNINYKDVNEDIIKIKR
jgi:hypothetical protein